MRPVVDFLLCKKCETIHNQVSYFCCAFNVESFALFTQLHVKRSDAVGTVHENFGKRKCENSLSEDFDNDESFRESLFYFPHI
jgi:hypothetical protein